MIVRGSDKLSGYSPDWGLTYNIYLRLTIQLTLMVTFETSVKFSVTIFHYAL